MAGRWWEMYIPSRGATHYLGSDSCCFTLWRSTKCQCLSQYQLCSRCTFKTRASAWTTSQSGKRHMLICYLTARDISAAVVKQDISLSSLFSTYVSLPSLLSLFYFLCINHCLSHPPSPVLQLHFHFSLCCFFSFVFVPLSNEIIFTVMVCTSDAQKLYVQVGKKLS